MGRYQHLSNSIYVANPSRNEPSLKVDQLICLDLYWKLVTSEVCLGKSGQIAIHAQLGWVLSGTVMMAKGLQSFVSLLAMHVQRIDAPIHQSDNFEVVLHCFCNFELLGLKANRNKYT